MKTFKAVNGLFSKNFSKLTAKGVAYLEVENPEEGDDVSEAGVNIVVKMAKGKYFDVSSLSGGEQALVAISLLFAIAIWFVSEIRVFNEFFIFSISGPAGITPEIMMSW